MASSFSNRQHFTVWFVQGLWVAFPLCPYAMDIMHSNTVLCECHTSIAVIKYCLEINCAPLCHRQSSDIGVGLGLGLGLVLIVRCIFSRTHKSRRKADRKKRSLREGSANEEEALVEALTDIVSTVDSLQDDVGTLLPSLVQFGFTKEAGAVQRSFAELMRSLRMNMATIWPSGDNAAIGAADIQVLHYYTTAIAGEHQLFHSLVGADLAKCPSQTCSLPCNSKSGFGSSLHCAC